MDLANLLSQIDLTNESQQQQLLQCYERFKEEPQYVEFACQAIITDQYASQPQVSIFYNYMSLQSVGGTFVPLNVLLYRVACP